MSQGIARKLTPVPHKNVEIDGGFWGPRLKVNRDATIPYIYDMCKETGRVDAWRLEWKPGQPKQPHNFWDSDIAKLLESAAYSLVTHPDKALEKKMDDIVDLIAQAQHEDGYLNIWYSVVAPGKQWTNLRDMHELYCAGHLIEAAVAYYEATGKRKFLDVMARYADHIDSLFGPEEGKNRGYPGHEEIELALVKLYHATGNKKYLQLAKFFIDERGRQPFYYDIEARVRGEEPGGSPYVGLQSHLPVREQLTAEGHAVRAMYLYTGMADVAAETADKTLFDGCERLWKNVVERKMYITGGIGSTRHSERFALDYYLPNNTAYAETCAAIGLVFWAHRMLQFAGDGKYADVIERALYNGIISGVSRDGKLFFYENPLAVHPETSKSVPGYGVPVRQKWFGCICCLPNVSRLLASLGGYIYSVGKDEVFVHLFVEGRAALEVGGSRLTLAQKTEYPWKESVSITVEPEKPTRFAVALRIPAWCKKATVKVNGKSVRGNVQKGYLKIRRVWQEGDKVDLVLPMPVERIEANPKVHSDCGRVALQRGPVLYCLEEVDNGPDLDDIALPRKSALVTKYDGKLLGGVTVITGRAKRRDLKGWKGELYRPAGSGTKSVRIKAVPYCCWNNRGEGEMLVWIREC